MAKQKAPVWYLAGPFTRYNEDVKDLARKAAVRIIDARYVPADQRQDAAPEKDLPKVTEKGGKAPAQASSGNPDAVGRKTYWKNAQTGEVGVTEKGDVLPEGVETITKAEHDKANAEKAKAE